MPTKNTRGTLQLEHVGAGDPRDGFEPGERFGFIRYLEHGIPRPLVRWHYHEEYELHLICASSGKVFVGDYIGQFGPGHLVLTSPRMPHNWVSVDVPEEGVRLRDMAIHFTHVPLEKLGAVIPEMKSIQALLDRAAHGIEFFDMSEQALRRFTRIRDTTGMARFIEFLSLLSELADSGSYQLLSTVPMQSSDDDDALARISSAVDYIVDNFTTQFSMRDLACQLGMSERMFTRFFRAATGNCFTDFLTSSPT